MQKNIASSLSSLLSGQFINQINDQNFKAISNGNEKAMPLKKLRTMLIVIIVKKLYIAI